MKILKIILIVLVSLAILIFIIFVFSNTFKHYVGDYFATIGLSSGRSYSMVEEIYGEPISIVSNEDSQYYFTAYYDGIEFYFHADSVSAVRIYSSKYRFGRKNIGVGSTRNEVKRAYDGSLHNIAKWLERTLFNEGRPVSNGVMKSRPDGGFTVIDGITWLEFYFDENEKVNKIVMYDNGP